MKKQIVAVMLLLVICVQLCACQASPSENVVSSKNDGTFDVSKTQSATEQLDGLKHVRYSDTFNSTDGSIEFTMNIDKTLEFPSMPVAEIVPHYFTGEEIQHIAHVLFGDIDFFEREPGTHPRFSKSQLQKNISRWSQYANNESMMSLYPNNDDPTEDVNYLKTYIDLFTKWYETAPNENPHTLCDWEFKKERHYMDSEVEIGGRDISEDSDVIYANTETNNIEYILAATTRNKDDYQISEVDIGLGSGIGPVFIDLAIYRAMLCRTEEPSEEQISEITIKAQQILDRINICKWEIADVSVQTTYLGKTPEYKILVNAVPQIKGVPAIYGQKIPNITDSSNFNANYPISVVNFEFSANGDLVYFQMTSPFEIAEIINENVAILSLDSLIEKAKSHLILSDASAGYGLPDGLVNMYEEIIQEKLVCKIEICDIQFGLGRARVAENNTGYCYVPVFVCKGKADYYGKDSEQLYISSANYGSELHNLVWINAVDGTIFAG